MRSVKVFVGDIIRKPPVMFPWVALFHLVMLGYLIVLYSGEPLTTAGWLQPLWMLGYTVFWIGVCDLRKWGAYGYLGLTIANLLIYATTKNVLAREIYTSSLFLIDAAFSFFVLLFFRRFR